MIELFMVVAYFIITTAAGKIMNGKGDNSIQHFFVAKKHLGIGLTVALMFGGNGCRKFYSRKCCQCL